MSKFAKMNKLYDVSTDYADNQMRKVNNNTNVEMKENIHHHFLSVLTDNFWKGLNIISHLH